MTHRHGELIAAAALMIGIAATACSNDSPSRTSNVQKPAAPAPAATSYRPPAVETPAPVVAGPVSFADGEAAYHAGNYVEATQVFTRYIGERPDNAWGHYMLGLSAWKAGDLAGAEEAFETSLRLDPTHVKSLVNLSRVHLDADRPGDAIATLTEARELDPSSPIVHRLLGRAYGLQGHIEDAIAAYQQAIDLDGQDSWSLNNLGLLFLEQGQPGEALPLLSRAVDIRADVPAFHNNLGMALEHAGRFTDATAAYGKALAADPGYEKAARNMARVEQVKVPQEPLDERVDSGPAEPGDVEAASADVTEDAAATSAAVP